MHHCWSCGFGGTLGDLVEKVLGLDWREAKEWLGSDAVAEDRPVASSVELKQRPWDSRFRLPAGVETLPLEKWPASARDYLLVTRGILPEQVKKWGIGFSVEGRLHGRIVFVKRNADGDPVGYSARTFIGGLRRYLEPEPWEGASPAAIYGEQFWPESVDPWEHSIVFVVEGAINGLAIERALPGANFAATGGSQLNVLVASKLARFGEIVAVTDPDAAGDKLALVLSEALARHEKKFRRIRLPAGKDTASLAVSDLKEALSW